MAERLGKAVDPEALDGIAEEQRQALADVDKRLEALASSLEDGLQELRAELEAQKQSLEAVGSDTAAQEMIEKLQSHLKQIDEFTEAAAKHEEIESVGDSIKQTAEELTRRIDEVAETAPKKAEEAVAELRSSLDEMKQTIETIPESGSVQDLADELKGEMGSLREAMDEAVSRTEQRVEELSEKVSRDVEALRQKLAESVEAPADADAISEEIQMLRQGLSVLESLADEVTPDAEPAAVATATAEGEIEIDVLTSKLSRTENGTAVECTLTLANSSDKPIEIVSVKAELDSGKARMTPTVNKFWLPAGVEAENGRKIALPMKVLEESMSEEVQYTVDGWPLEKAMEAYNFTITLADEHGTEYSTTVPLDPPT